MPTTPATPVKVRRNKRATDGWEYHISPFYLIRHVVDIKAHFSVPVMHFSHAMI